MSPREHCRDGQIGRGDQLVDRGPTGEEGPRDERFGLAKSLDGCRRRGIATDADIGTETQVRDELRDARHDPRQLGELAQEREAAGGCMAVHGARDEEAAATLFERPRRRDQRTGARRCLDHDRGIAEAADDPVAPWECALGGSDIGCQLRHDRATGVDDRLAEAPMRRRPQHGVTATDDGDRDATRSDRGFVGRTVDPERQPRDDGRVGCDQRLRDPRRDVAPGHRRAAGPHDRHGTVTGERRLPTPEVEHVRRHRDRREPDRIGRLLHGDHTDIESAQAADDPGRVLCSLDDAPRHAVIDRPTTDSDLGVRRLDEPLDRTGPGRLHQDILRTAISREEGGERDGTESMDRGQYGPRIPFGRVRIGIADRTIGEPRPDPDHVRTPVQRE